MEYIDLFFWDESVFEENVFKYEYDSSGNLFVKVSFEEHVFEENPQVIKNSFELFQEFLSFHNFPVKPKGMKESTTIKWNGRKIHFHKNRTLFCYQEKVMVAKHGWNGTYEKVLHNFFLQAARIKNQVS
jgi:hypothetical protein